MTARIFRDVLERLCAEGTVVRRDSLLASPGHRVELGADEALANRLVDALAAAGYTPPEIRLLEAELGVPRRRLVNLLGVLEKSGRVVRVADDLYYAGAAIAAGKAVLERALAEQETITAAEFRDRLDVSRKFSIALLDYFDRTGVTLRVGDARKLRRAEPVT